MSRLKLLVFIAVLGWAGSAMAANSGSSIALNFGASEPEGAEEATVTGAAGVAGTQNWNNLIGNEGFGGDDDIFLDVGGSPVESDVSVEWISNNTWSTDGRGNEDTNDAPEGNDRALMLGYLDTTDSSITEIKVEGIPGELAGGYDVFLYVQNGVLNRGGLYTVIDENGATEQTNVTVNPFNGAYTVGEEGNYLLFEGLSGTELTIEGMAQEGLVRGPINAVEICAAGACTALPNAVAGRGTIGNQIVQGSRENQVFGPAEDEGPGLAQEWFSEPNPGNKAALDDIFDNNEPVVPTFRGENGTWWTGNSTPIGDLVDYPTEIDPPLTDNYSVRLTGEILIEESGTFRFADGVDDFTYLAIDADKSGVAGDVPEEVLIEDNTWTSVLRDANNGGEGLGEIDLDVAEGGEWIAIEFNAAEGGGGDSGVLYWDYKPGEGIGAGEGFPEFPEDPIFEDEAAALLVPESHLRSATRPLLSADINGSLPDSAGGWEFEINASDGTADAFVLENPDSNIFTTNLDVDGANFVISVEGDVSAGDSYQIIVADNITGTPSVFPPDWVFSSNGFITFGSGVAGDFNGNGMRDTDDIDILSAAVRNNETDSKFDLNGDGNVDAADRTEWVEVLTNTHFGDSNFDGEFSSSDFVTVFVPAKYETGQPAGWVEGDWNGDGEFTSSDFVAAFIGGGYESGPRPGGLQAVPEPSTLAMLLLGMVGLSGLVRRK